MQVSINQRCTLLIYQLNVLIHYYKGSHQIKLQAQMKFPLKFSKNYTMK